jgi:glycosyltransferase involved in cell wall biosynthesis
MRTPLRFLCILDLPWEARLGASQVYVELAQAWRDAGHTVATYTLRDAFARPATSRLGSMVHQFFFPWKAAAFVRNNAREFDVIDSLLGTLPFSKQSLRFDKLVVARSVGLYHLYQQFDRMARRRWPAATRGRLIGRLAYNLSHWLTTQFSKRALRYCDIVAVPTEQESDCLRCDLGSHKPVLVLPYGLRVERRETFRRAACPAASRIAARKVCFVGMWSVRKGAKDWGEIIRCVRRQISDARFLFVGTLTDDRNVWRDLALEPCSYVQIIREYSPDQLPTLLADSTVGGFPSYVEGFPLGVIEQLAARLPVIAYRAPGPVAMLQEVPELLVPVGATASFAGALVKVMQSDVAVYEQLVARCSSIVDRLLWSTIAQKTAEAYQLRLEALGDAYRA